VAALKWDALVDAATAAAYIDIAVPAGGSQDETNLYGLINGVSRSIRKYTERVFTPERTGPLQSDPIATGVVKTFDYDGAPYLKLRPFEPRTITAVSLIAASDTGSPTTLTSNRDFLAMPRNKTEEGTYLWLQILNLTFPSLASFVSGYDTDIPRRGYPRNISGGYAVAVTGDWGMAAIPDDVAQAALITIDEEWTNPGDFEQRDVGDITAIESPAPTRALGGYSTPFPPRAMNILNLYKRGAEI
jgi:hypothetical protein